MPTIVAIARLDRGDVEMGLTGFLGPPGGQRKLPEELLLIEWEGDGFVESEGGNGSESSSGCG